MFFCSFIGEANKSIDSWARNVRAGLHGGSRQVGKRNVLKVPGGKGAQAFKIRIDIDQDRPPTTESAEEKDGDDTNANKTQGPPHTSSRSKNSNSLKESVGKVDMVLHIPEKIEIKLEDEVDTDDDDHEHSEDSRMVHIGRNVADRNSESLDQSFTSTLKQNLLSVHEIKTEKPGDLDKVSESYKGAVSASGPQKASLDRKKDGVVADPRKTKEVNGMVCKHFVRKLLK